MARSIKRLIMRFYNVLIVVITPWYFGLDLRTCMILERFLGLPTQLSFQSWPKDIGRYWVQAQRSLEGKNWDAAAVMARSAVQLALRHHNAVGKNLYQEIDDLAGKGILPPVMKDWSHEVRELGNDSAHPTPASSAGTESNDAKDVVQFLSTLLQMLYDLPHKIEQYRARNAS